MSDVSKVRATVSRFADDAWLASTTWRGPNAARALQLRRTAADICVVWLALVMPWSTSTVSGVTIIVLIAVLQSVQIGPFLQSLKRASSALPLALFLLAVIGTLWASGIPWADRGHAISQVFKLLLIPFLIYHFQTSPRAHWVLAAFVASSFLLMAYSFLVFYAPSLAFHFKADQPGVPIKNYIDQSQGFALCAIWLAALAIEAWRVERYRWAAAFIAIAAAFLLNLIFINVARTAFLYLPVMLLLLLYRYLSGKRFVAALVASAVIILGLWAASPNLQQKFSRIFTEYEDYSAPIGEKGPASVAMRLEFWRKSIGFFEAAPIAGHGTGSIRSLFTRDAVGQTGFSALVVANPHNQTLTVAIQWGLLGCALLYAMWISHLLLFRDGGLVAWLGLVAVAQNIVSSLFNSHLFDFYQGWLYVIVVGVAGGLVRARESEGEAFSVKRI
jgi:O-antigen ligase